MPNQTQLLKIPQVADRLVVSRRTVLSLIHRGDLVAVSVGNGTKLPAYRVSEAALARYLKVRTVKPKAKT